MSTPNDPSAELDQLLMALVDGELTPEQQQHLSALLRDDPSLQTKYRDYMLLDSLLRWEQPAAPALAPAPARSAQRWARRLALAGALAASVLAGVGVWYTWPRTQPARQDLADEATDNTVAILMHAPGAVWEGADAPKAGTLLAAGPLRLKSGYAHLEFYSGATVILEGPAELWLTSRTAAYIARGKLRATVPPSAQGFRIATRSVDVVDRGTEFGVSVDGEDRAEVHVFQGKVEMFGPTEDAKGPPRSELTTGQGLRMDGVGVGQRIPPAPAAFPTARQVAARSEDELARRHKAWEAAVAAVRDDPALVAHYTFQSGAPFSRTLPDASLNRPAHDGAIVGCSWTGGRWPGKHGLEFKRVSDRVRLNVPGEFESVTLAAWVRVEALPNMNNALLMADGWEPGSLHWQIGEGGKLVLGVQSKPKGKGANYHAMDVFTPDRFGRWTHLAVTYDRAGRLVTHYVDGQPVVQLPTRFDIPLRLGDADIGNWNLASHKNNHPVRHFTGCMDEVMVFKRALGDDEVLRLHEAGRPPS